MRRRGPDGGRPISLEEARESESRGKPPQGGGGVRLCHRRHCGGATGAELGWFRLECGCVCSRRVGSSTRWRVLLPLIQRLLERAGLGQENVGALVVGTGPGTFTGVRIAVSTGRALALALACPVFGVGTLDAIAAQAIAEMDTVAPYAEGAAVVPLVDARRRQVFAATYARSATGWKAGEIFAAEPGEVVSRVRGGWEGARVLCTGAEVLVDKCRVEGAGATLPRVFDAAYLVLGQERLSGGGKLQADLVKACRAAGGVSVASAPAGQWGSPESVTPIYVRPPDADIHITKMKDPWSGT